MLSTATLIVVAQLVGLAGFNILLRHSLRAPRNVEAFLREAFAVVREGRGSTYIRGPVGHDHRPAHD